MAQPTENRFLKALAAGPVICAEGYLFELERRGYVQIGPFVPEVVLNNPEAVLQLHREFARAGSDVIEAFTYYGHRSKLRLVNKEHLLEPLNKNAIALAQQVAAEFGGLLVAGNVCNTTTWEPTDPESPKRSREMFEEQIKWAAEAGVDLVIGETFDFTEEALIALDVIKQYNLPSVITFAIHRDGKLRDGKTPAEACKILKDNGATVVGLNCARGPDTMLPIIKEIRESVTGTIAALPVGYRTTHEHPTFQSLSTDDKKYQDLDPHTCTRFDMTKFAKDAVEAGAGYLGVCCGGAPHHVRAIAEALGRTPRSSEFSPDLSKHFVFGNKTGLKDLAKDHWLERKNEF